MEAERRPHGNPKAEQRRDLRPIASLLLSGLLGGCSAEADIPRLIVEQSDVQFEAAPPLAAALSRLDESRSISTSFEHPEGFELPDSLNPRLHATAVRISGREGSEDLSFIRELELVLASHSPDAPEPRPLATYERGEASGPIQVIELTTDAESNVVDFWDTEQAYYEVTASGALPEQDWSVDVTVEFRGSLALRR